MGCATSKLDSEDTVRRCRERRRLMQEAVRARHQLAAAHADYRRSLRITGSALCAFAAGEQLAVSEETPPVLLQTQPAVDPIPPPSVYSPSPAPSIVGAKPPHPRTYSPIPNGAKVEREQNRVRRNMRPQQRTKLPHILSESESSPGRSVVSAYRYPKWYRAESTYSNTPSQASSTWNWENFYPPSPPDSEYFDRKESAQQKKHHLEVEDQETDSGDESEIAEPETEYDFFRPPRDARSNVSNRSYFAANHNGNSCKKQVDVETEREEVQCSEWEDHDHDCYSTTSSSSDPDADQIDEQSRVSDIGPETRSRSGSFRQQAPAPPPSQSQPTVNPYSFDGKSEKSYRNSGTGELSTDMRLIVRHKNLKEIMTAIQRNFDDAASAGDQLSEILEIDRAQLDHSFRNLKKTVYHSNSMLSTLSSSWTSRPPLAVKYRLDAEAGGGPRSLLSTVERLLAWEKKLYNEVKAREGVRREHEKKLSTLQSQEYKGESESKLDKTKASIKRLTALIIVHSEAVTTTSTAITHLRDSDLVPQLVELCHGTMYMWRSMHQYHEVQNIVVQQVRGLVNNSATADSTTELHRVATRELESAVTAWHSSFCRLMKFHRDFIQSIQSWFKLTLLAVNNDNTGNRLEPSDAYNFFEEWMLALSRVPDTVASEAIKSFINVVHVISVKQTEEIKIKRRTESVSKELEKKSSSLRNIERKFYHSYSMVGLGLSDSRSESGLALDARDPLADKKVELAACQRRVEDEIMRHAKASEVTRAMTLNNLQTGLPGVFQAMTNFSSLFAEALAAVCTRSYAIK